MSFNIIKNIFISSFIIIPLICKLKKKKKKSIEIPTYFKPKKRFETINRLKNHKYDILIIGGGSSGVGVALDATTRGLSVALIEKNDFGSGTSSKSSKLLHGGIRYLEKAWNQLNLKQFLFVKDALKERNIVMKMIPHLCKPINFMIPIYNRFLIPYYYIGMKLYNYLSKDYKSTIFLNKLETKKEYPNIKSTKLIGSVIYKDGFFLDFRANIMLMMTASFYGADVINYVELIKFEYKNNKIINAIVYDKINKKVFNIKSKVFISTTGPFTDSIRKIAKEKNNILETSSGSHIIINKKFGPKNNGFVDPNTNDKLILFFIPYNNKIICGSTDYKSKNENLPKSQIKDIKFLLNEIRKYLKDGIKITYKDIKSTWCGIRPLIKDNNKKSTSDLLRTHIIKQTKTGLIILTGGKWTNFRKIAEETINFIIKKFNFSTNKCITKEIKSIGSHKYNINLYKEISNKTGLNENLTKRLQDLYGDQLNILINYFSNGKTFISKKYNFTKEEVEYNIDYEYAMKPADILLRRTGIAFFDVKEADNCIDDLMKIFSNKFNYGKSQYNNEKKELINELNSVGLWLKNGLKPI